MLSALTLFAAALTTPHCEVTRPDACASTNVLVGRHSFQAALRAFLRGTRGSYLGDDLSVYDQASEVLGGPPDDPRRLADGAWLFTACRAHSCTEKGAVVVSATGRVRAVGILAFDCHKVPHGQPACERSPLLTVFVPRVAASADLPFLRELTAWASDAAEADRRALPILQGPFQGVEMRGVLDEAVTSERGSARPGGQAPG